MSVFVLWEDRAVSTIAKFGPHTFLIACVAQRLGQDRYTLTRAGRIKGKSCAGNARLLDELKDEPLWNSALHVVAVLDTDRLHDQFLGLPSRRTILDTDYEHWCSTVEAKVRDRAPLAAQSRLQVGFLDRNLETLLSVVGRGAPELDDALGKDRLRRDKILQRAAGDEGLVSRACAEMPSWELLVTTVARLLA